MLKNEGISIVEIFLIAILVAICCDQAARWINRKSR